MTVVGNGVDFPTCRPIRSLKYIGGSAHALAGRGISSVIDEIKFKNVSNLSIFYKKQKLWQKCVQPLFYTHYHTVPLYCIQ